MPVRSLPARPHLDQLKRQARELLRRQPEIGRLRDAQRALASEYGFSSWDALRRHVQALAGAAHQKMMRPPELDSVEGGATWSALVAADTGNLEALRELLERDQRLSRAAYWYTPAIHFAVRGGHADAVKLLLEAGADPEWNGLHDGSLIVMARDRGHLDVVRLLEEARERRGRVLAGSDQSVHAAIARNAIDEVRRVLDADPGLVNAGNAVGASPLHRAVGLGSYEIVGLLLERGADVHAVLSSSRGLAIDW